MSAWTPLLLVSKPDSDAILGLKLRNRIVKRGPFEVIVPPSSGPRYEEITRAKAAVLCRARAERGWFATELEALIEAMASSQQFDLRRPLLVPGPDDLAGLNLLGDEAVLHSDEALDGFLANLNGQAAAAA